MPEPGGTIQFVADRGDARLRLDQVLVRRVREVSRMSRTVAQEWIDAGAVTIDGEAAARPSVRVREGAAIAVALPPATALRARPEPEEAALDILYEDAHLIAVNKPPGIVVHPSYKQTAGTLLNAVLWHVRGRADAQPGILTRLDKDTSGLVVLALDARVHAAMQRDAAGGRVRKEYLAIVRGTPRPPGGRITLALAHDPNDRRRIIASPGGMPSETIYEVLSPEIVGHTHLSLVRCELVTGRTHQIRVHLASSGWPILGDRVYGEPDDRIARQALHAWRISLPHPVTREGLTIEAPVPADMQALVSSHPAT